MKSTDIQKAYIGSTEVEKIYMGSDLIYPTSNVDYSTMYTTVEMLTSGTLSVEKTGLYYSLDNGNTWTNMGANTQTPTLSAGTKVLLKRTGYVSWGIGRFYATGDFKIYGNSMSLLYGDDFAGHTSLTGTYALHQTFYHNTHIIDAENYILPSLNVTNNGYSGMFLGCTNLIKAPKYLPATQLDYRSYQSMFEGCSSLIASPELQATTLAQQSHYYMFNGCTSLKYVKCLATDISASSCTTNWLNNVASSGTFVKNPNMSSWTTGVDGIPRNWTVVDA